MNQPWLEGWSFESLKAYIDERFRAGERALDKAADDLNIRLHDMNVFRAQIVAERGSLISKDEYEQRHITLEQHLDVIEAKFEARVLAIERWQSKIFGALAILIFLFPIISGLILWATSNHRAP